MKDKYIKKTKTIIYGVNNNSEILRMVLEGTLSAQTLVNMDEKVIIL
jgi:hypothetical protein